MRQNKIANYTEFEKIKFLPNVTNLNAKENPCSEDSSDGAKKNILMILYEQLKKCNKDEVTPEEKEEVVAELKERER